MRKYKLYAGFLSLAMACSLIMPVSAEDYSDTEAWYAKCSQAQTSQAGVKACQGFQEYQKNRKQSLQNSIETYTSSIASLQSDTTKMEQLAKEQKELVSNLQTQISEKEKSIELIENNIKELEEKILRKAEYEAGCSESEKHGHETGFSEVEKHGHETGFSEGEKYGIERGTFLNSIETAKRMLKLQEFSLEKIAAISGLSLDEVKKLQ